MKTVYTVVREYMGTKGYKSFDTKEEAEKFLNSDSVREDKDDGFNFYITEETK